MYVKMGSEYLQMRIHILIVNIEYIIKYKEVIMNNKDSFWMMTSSFVFLASTISLQLFKYKTIHSNTNSYYVIKYEEYFSLLFISFHVKKPKMCLFFFLYSNN